ncbi:hypothetical protein M1615_05005, partial [Patescibacteria group bacterium]|nr:hypothetical protein [Patescibacteria group bacterium]
FAVVYPNLPTHPNFELAARLFPDGAAPVFFIQSAAFNDQGDAIARALWENPVIRGSCELGQSFGFAKTRIWLAPNDSGVRVSGGLETKDQLEILQEAFKESLSNMH